MSKPTRALCFTLADYSLARERAALELAQRTQHGQYTHYLLTGEGAYNEVPEGYDYCEPKKCCRCEACRP